jgi:predicted nucleotidyltransferase
MATLPPEVARLTTALLAGIREALRNNFVGAYLTGSLALGGFDPATSDVDLVVVTETLMSDREFATLDRFHQEIPPLGNRFSLEYEVYYIDRHSLRRHAPGQRFVRVEPGYGTYRTEERPNWVLERWTLRERGIIVLGPDQKILIDQVSPDDIRAAAGGELLLRLRNWQDGTWPLSELSNRGSQGFEVETACRALFTITTGQICSKSEAITWALPYPARKMATAHRVVAASPQRPDRRRLPSPRSAQFRQMGSKRRLTTRIRGFARY